MAIQSSVILLAAFTVTTLASGPCMSDQDCQELNRTCSGGMCVCRPGTVEWKWECYTMVGLGESCITSAQCHYQAGTPSHVCNPITLKCSCERGFTPVRDSRGIMGCADVYMKSSEKSLQPNLQPDYSRQVHTVFQPESRQAINLEHEKAEEDKQVPSSNWMLIVLLILGGGVVITTSILYLKTLQEKKASQARVKSLLRIVAEQNDTRPSLSSLSSFTTNVSVDDERYMSMTFNKRGSVGKLDFLGQPLPPASVLDRPPRYEDLLG